MPSIAPGQTIDFLLSARRDAVVVKRGVQVTETEIKAHLRAFSARGLISAYAVPERIAFVDELPKTSVGKLDKKVLRQEHP